MVPCMPVLRCARYRWGAYRVFFTADRRFASIHYPWTSTNIRLFSRGRIVLPTGVTTVPACLGFYLSQVISSKHWPVERCHAASIGMGPSTEIPSSSSQVLCHAAPFSDCRHRIILFQVASSASHHRVVQTCDRISPVLFKQHAQMIADGHSAAITQTSFSTSLKEICRTRQHPAIRLHLSDAHNSDRACFDAQVYLCSAGSFSRTWITCRVISTEHPWFAMRARHDECTIPRLDSYIAATLRSFMRGSNVRPIYCPLQHPSFQIPTTYSPSASTSLRHQSSLIYFKDGSSTMGRSVPAIARLRSSSAVTPSF